ncbi:MAG: alpha-amylase family glycosyl hydrolase [Eubacterium sp.]|nr:alpha-amylase family glycosyl hydrolase [Eubacterium sp.]
MDTWKDIQVEKTIDFMAGAGDGLGVLVKSPDRIQISIWKKDAEKCQLCLYGETAVGGRKTKKIPMASFCEIGAEDVFSVTLCAPGLCQSLQGVSYDFCIDGSHVVDPYAKRIRGREKFGRHQDRILGVFDFQQFSWDGDKKEKLPVQDMILYQCHVRGFTKHVSSGVETKERGTFAGLQRKIPYLKDLGINAILLMPVYDFDELMKDEKGTPTGKINYWGYAADAFYFAPKASYGSGDESTSVELKKMIKEIHREGIQIILDMYFTKQRPEFIVRCLRYYVTEFHVDGFRINQDSIDLCWIMEDPILSHIKLIGSHWDEQPVEAGKERLLEMNDGFLVDARRYLKSDEGQTQGFAYRMREQKKGVGVIHYIAQNNGFTLRDLISYDVKHNEENGEKNQDGTDLNYSWNCGAEGPSRKKIVRITREKQERNALVMNFLGMASPMLLAGDEFGNTQKGNNNAYCQDNNTTWLDWRLAEKNRDTFEFVRQLIAFRKKQPLYHQDHLLTGMDGKGLGMPDVSFHGTKPWKTDFSYYSRELGILFYGGYYQGESLYFAFNFHWDEREFFLPDVEIKGHWEVLFDTSIMYGSTPKKVVIADHRCTVAPRSILVLKSVKEQRDAGK